MDAASDEIQQLVGAQPLDADRLGALLDRLAPDERVAVVRAWNGGLQRSLWAACRGRGTRLEDFVPADAAPGSEVIHAGRNSLPLFRLFEKRFTAVEGRNDILYGYNEGAARPLVGPGYYVAHYDSDRGEVGIDYFQIPPADARLPRGWPRIKPNESGIQRFVYAGMVDFMRKVSSHVTIGRAYRGGREALPHTFLLVRMV
jgi:hypothetical protein